MRSVLKWLFGDIGSVVAPRPDRGPRRPATRRGARWLIGAGLFVTLFGVIGFAGESGDVLENQPATVIDRYTSRLQTGHAYSRLEKVTLRFEDGTTKSIALAPLYDAVGTRKDVPVRVDVDPDTHLVDAVYLNGTRFGTGRQSAAVVVTIVFIALGIFLLLRGIGRLRRARLVPAV